MSVFLTINLVKREKDTVLALTGSDKYKVVELDGFRDLFFSHDQTSTIQQLAAIASVDQSVFNFFAQSNGESYGDEEYKHCSFSPAEVRNLLENTRSALENPRGPWVELYHYLDLVDDNGQSIEEALVEYSDDKSSTKYCLAKPYIEGTHCFLTIYCGKKQRKAGEISLLNTTTELFTFTKTKTIESITLGNKINWVINSFNQIESIDGRVYQEVAIPKDKDNTPTDIDQCYLCHVRSSKNNINLDYYNHSDLSLSHSSSLSVNQATTLYSYRVKMVIERKPEDKIHWILKKERYNDWIERDIDATLLLCDYAESHGYELQVWQS